MKLTGILVAVAGIILFVWYWRRNYEESPLEKHYNDLDARQSVGNLAQTMQYSSVFPIATLGEGWATTVRVNPANPNSAYGIGKTRFSYSFAQPSAQ